MEISLIIPAHNEEQYIGATLDSVHKMCGAKLKEVIVVDNASTDKTAEIAQQKGATVLHEVRKGTGFARQAGFEHSKADVLAFIDADTRIPEGWIEKIEQVFQDPQVSLLSGPYRYFDGSWFTRTVLNAIWWIFSPITYRVVGYMALGGNVAVRRSALASVGGFDLTIQFYGDDTDLAKRMHKVGKTIYRMDFYDYSSSRRFQKHGIIKTNIMYAFNYLWPVMFGRPYTPGVDNLEKHTA